MRALIITKSGRDIINVMNFLVTIGYKSRNIITVMESDLVTQWWEWMVESNKCFVYLDPCINDLTFSAEPFTPKQLRELIFNSPKVLINIFIASNESFELLWIYDVSKMYSTTKPTLTKSHLYSHTESDVIVVSGKTQLCKYLSDIHGLCYSHIVEYYGMNVSFSKIPNLMDKFL